MLTGCKTMPSATRHAAAGIFGSTIRRLTFKKTILFAAINIEWVGGPDLYFRVETLSGTVLLAEPPLRGRAPDRENAGPCSAWTCASKSSRPLPTIRPF